MRVLQLILAALLMAGCAEKKVKENPPAPAVVEVPVATYVPIAPELRKRCKWQRDGKPSQVFAVSNGRKACLLQYEAQLDGIDQVQGKPVPDTEQ